ncbi:MAG: hypothetical protein QOK67_10350, partial [Nitrososphaeraceae archaeon]|nr:hypothetical protein [Nitrososphaeraceae archaeon]
SYKESDCNMDMKKSNSCNVILETNSKKFLLDSKDSNNNLSLIYILKSLYSLKMFIEIYGIVGLTGLQKYLVYYPMMMMIEKIENDIEFYINF